MQTPQQLIDKISQFVNSNVLEFIKGQIVNGVKSKTGMRYGVQERRFALAMYHHSPKAYRFLSSVFKLPSVSALHSWFHKIPSSTGWNKPSLAGLKKKAETLSKEETLCGIIFDAKSFCILTRPLTPSLGGRILKSMASFKMANHALVFIVKGLIYNWKMVLGYFFNSGGINYFKNSKRQICK